MISQQKNILTRLSLVLVRCQPDLKLCTVLISTFGNGGLPGLAESAMVYAQAQGLQPDAIAYTALVHAYAQGGLWTEAENAIR